MNFKEYIFCNTKIKKIWMNILVLDLIYLNLKLRKNIIKKCKTQLKKIIISN